MPKVFEYKKFRFFFYSNDKTEPMHVHVKGPDGKAKFWVGSGVNLSWSSGLDAPTINELAKVVEQNAELIERAWNDHFS
jgi:hypothetical protein